MVVFWDVAPCSLVDTDQLSEELTASIIRMMSKLHTPWPDLNGTASLPNADLTTCAEHAVHAWSLSPSCPLQAEGNWESSLGEAHRLDDVPGQHSSDATEGRTDIWQKGDQGRFLQGWGYSLQWIESLSDLSVALAILPESGPEKLQLITQDFSVTKGFWSRAPTWKV
jgi:hypothetical protein